MTSVFYTGIEYESKRASPSRSVGHDNAPMKKLNPERCSTVWAGQSIKQKAERIIHNFFHNRP